MDRQLRSCTLKPGNITTPIIVLKVVKGGLDLFYVNVTPFGKTPKI